ncbi:DNA mismatch endonuclease Vsr [Mesorhizobium sp. M1322]|uniref:very short patch repair endonuclease n=1 Tax=Mesorhizobium sp. M1322 TaxID=2957081 RepID=UPI00333DF9B0
MDIVSPAARSRMMGRIRGKDTGPEMLVRKVAHQMGYRFRLHRHDLPGTPDIVFPARKTAMFIHGCFWHRHEGCKYCYNPKSNIDFWQRKFDNNVQRDQRVRKDLERLGWNITVIWACETADQPSLRSKLRAYLEP